METSERVKIVLFGDIGLSVFSYIQNWKDTQQLLLTCKAALQSTWFSKFVSKNRYHFCQNEKYQRIKNLIGKLKFCDLCYEKMTANHCIGTRMRLASSGSSSEIAQSHAAKRRLSNSQDKNCRSDTKSNTKTNGSEDLVDGSGITFPSVTNVRLECCPIDKLHQIVYADQITSMKITESFTDMSEYLSLYTYVKYLELNSVTLTSFEFLSHMPNLEEFLIDNSNEVVVPDYLPLNWRPFQDCKKLTSLSIVATRDSHLELHYLSHLSNLKLLNLNLHSISDFSFLSHMKSLEGFVIFSEIDNELEPSLYESLEQLAYASYQGRYLFSEETLEEEAFF